MERSTAHGYPINTTDDVPGNAYASDYPEREKAHEAAQKNKLLTRIADMSIGKVESVRIVLNLPALKAPTGLEEELAKKPLTELRDAYAQISRLMGVSDQK